MPSFYGYANALFGSQTSAGTSGGPIDYRFEPPSTWSYTGSNTYFVVKEERTSNTAFNGDPTNEVVADNLQVGGNRAQTVVVGGQEVPAIWDYTFEVGLGAQVWRVGVIDVDLNQDGEINAGAENGYFLVFPDGFPPADTDLSYLGIVENDSRTSHAGLGADVVCFSAGTLIETEHGARAIETLAVGDLIVTRDGGLQELRWIGRTRVPARGKLAPIVISKGTLGTTRDLIVSPQHAVLIDDWRASLLFGQEDVLIRAVDLLGHDGVYRKSGGMVTYCHLLFDAHHLVKAAGIWSESLFPGEITRSSVSPAARDEIVALFPELEKYGPKSARCLRRFEAACLTA